MSVKTTVVPRIAGQITLTKVRSFPAPSLRAASEDRLVDLCHCA